MEKHMFRTLVTAIAFCMIGSRAFAQVGTPGKFDWPQWQGPDRTNISKETGLLQTWPKDGPKLLWKIDGLGAGYSTPTVAAGRIFLMGNLEKIEYVFARKEADGSPLWRYAVGPERSNGGGYPGPRCSPLIDGNRMYALGLNGDLVCLDIASGIPVWRRDLRKEFNGSPGGWGHTESPLLDGDKIIVTPGGKKATIVALKKTTGDTVWTAQVPEGDAAGYSSVIVANIYGVRQYIQFMQRGIVSIDANTGRFLWRHNGAANGTANISTPIAQGDLVFSASAYGKGGSLAKISREAGKWTAKEVYFTANMQNHHGGMIYLDGYLYGNNGGKLACLDYKTGKVQWQSNAPGKGSITYADGHLYYRAEGGRGVVTLVEATPKAYIEKGRFEQPDRSNRNSWAHPVVANGRLFLADQDILLCYDVKKR